jgi:hypothetical protein
LETNVSIKYNCTAWTHDLGRMFGRPCLVDSDAETGS